MEEENLLSTSTAEENKATIKTKPAVKKATAAVNPVVKSPVVKSPIVKSTVVKSPVVKKAVAKKETVIKIPAETKTDTQEAVSYTHLTLPTN